ncbi:GxxExxY protein [Sphingomonas sp. HF-S4]|uniref:GxxExxY protein n=1 Tax=Sphingomonas agrestis TaxID=3080540 RepID=A0ABU3Y4H7_9SPHN|nr:GxxExxY protein [Sphingomonas sp. HF-S4]MDV3456249.1 GxxExxY protein [Sphingomonas sp. HF-S4]
MKDIDRVSGDVVDVAIRLHRELGPGLFESVYEAVLAARLRAMGYAVATQRAIDIEFEGIRRLVNNHNPSASSASSAPLRE